MRIEQLEYLLEIAKANSFSSASENLYLTPQSLSRSVSKMENELGFKLFERSSQGVRFTEYGEIFLRSAHKIVWEYRRTLQEIQEKRYTADELSGELIIYTNPYFELERLPSVLEKFCAENPKIKVTVIERDPQGIYQWLQRAEQEGNRLPYLGIVLVPESREDFFDGLGKDNTLHFETLEIKPYYVYVGKEAPLAKKNELSIKELLEYPFVIFSSSEGNMTPLRFIAEQYGALNIIFTTSSITLWLNAISSGVGVGLFQDISSYMVKQNKLDMSSIAKIKLKEDIHAVSGCLYSLASGEVHHLIKVFMSYLTMIN